MLTYPLVGVGASLILVAVTQGQLGLISDLMKFQPLRYFGKISYGLYVYHIAGIIVAQNIADVFLPGMQDHTSYSAIVVIIAFMLTLLISSLSYQLLEKTFLRMKPRFTFVESRPVGDESMKIEAVM